MRLSVDDGCQSDLRLADLASKYEIETIFYLPVEWHSLAFDKGYKPLTLDEALFISENFEIGSHTITHRYLTRLDFDEAIYEITRSKNMLEYIFGYEITKFCPPRGYTNDMLTRVTMMHYEEQRLTKGKGLVHIHPDSGANKNRYWRDCINEETTELWCHSYDLDKFGLWDELEEVLSERTNS